MVPEHDLLSNASHRMSLISALTIKLSDMLVEACLYDIEDRNIHL
jgi:hypothetical protein